LPFTVSATSVIDSSVNGTANGIMTVLSQGVDVVLSHTTSGFQMTVTNTGAATDTFDLILAGPAVPAASLGLNEVTLAAGASQTIPISVGEINFALPGNLALIGIATSRANSEVRDADTTQIVVGAASGLAARFDTDVHVLPVPGTSSFLLVVKNTGNVDDRYEAVITGTTGPVLANLVGLDGLATQAVPTFLLSGLSSGAILLQTNLTAFGQGTVSIQVRSLTDGSLSRTVTATVASPTANVVTTTQVTALPNPADFGQQVIVTAIVSAQEGGPPPGSVTFIIDGTPQAPVMIQEINGQARAEITLPSLTAGTHTILASYGGSDPYSASTSALLSLTVDSPAAAATTTRLTAAPNPATNGEPILLTAIVTSADGLAPTGSVTFIIDGVSRFPVPLSVVDGQAQASLIVGNLAAGGHSITASYGGSAGFALSASDLLVQVAAPPTDRQGPQVVTFQRFGYHARPTTLVLTFNESMDPVHVQDATNYQLVDAHGRSIRITGAVYDPTAQTVTLHLRQRLDLNHHFKLTVNGATEDGLRDIQGNLLDGDNDGQIGGNFVTLVDRKALVIDRPTRVPPKHLLALPRKGPASHSFPSQGRPARLLGLSRSEQSQARRSSTVTQIHPLASQDAPKPLRFIPLTAKQLRTFAGLGRVKGHHMV
jgi:hypothetical protein